jgi:flagellar biosynthesis protein
MNPRSPRSREAVALAYGNRAAPVVTAKGRDELAEAIIAEAKRQGIYITEDRELVAALSRLDLEQEIPRDLYVAVAVVLSWAYWLQGMKPGDEKADQTSS